MASTPTAKKVDKKPTPAPKTVSLTIEKVMSQDVGLAVIMNQRLPISPSWRFGQWKELTEAFTKKANKRRDEIIKELGEKKENGNIEVLPVNKQEYFKQYSELIAEVVQISIPDIMTSSIKDVLMNVRFTTLIGHHLKNDAFPIKNASVEGLTRQQIIDADLGCAVIINEVLPAAIALKLGEAKRCCEAESAKYKTWREDLLKSMGKISLETGDYEITDEKKNAEFDSKVDAYLTTKVEVFSAPKFDISEFEVSISVPGEEKPRPVMLPSRFFTLFSPFIEAE